MKNLIQAIACFLFFSTYTTAQKTEKVPIKFGKVSPDDFKTVYSIDSNAHAVVIADVGYSGFIGNNSGWFSIEFTRQTRIHILNKNAYDAANFSIQLYSANGAEEELVNLKATTYTLDNGKVTETKLDKAAIFKERVDRERTNRKFTLPNIREGCIIEVEYKIKSDFISTLRAWAFQGEFPVLWSEYEVGIPEFFNYLFLSQGDRMFDIQKKDERRSIFSGADSRGAGAPQRFSFEARVDDHRWVKKNVPALKQEAFTSTLMNHISKIEFQLNAYAYPFTPSSVLGTWKEFNDRLMNDEEFGLPIKRDAGFLNDEIPATAKALKENNEEKAKLIYEYVRDNYTCTDHFALYMSQNLRNLLKTKNGNVADINLLLTTLLRNAGYKCYPVIMGLRSRGVTYSMYPIRRPFNYVITELHIGEKRIYLDASESMMGFGRLDPLCYNGHARVINGEPEPINFDPDELLEKKITSLFVINDEKGFLSGSVEQVPGYFESTDLRGKIKEKGREAVIADIKKSFEGETELENFRVDSLQKKDFPLGLYYDFTMKGEKEDIIYLNPMFGEQMKTNPFKSAQRYYPVEMPYTIDESFILSMDVPAGYVVDELPEPMILKLSEADDGLFEFRISESGGTISLRCRLRVKRTYFDPSEYEMLREFFNMVVAKQNEQIVFKKKK